MHFIKPAIKPLCFILGLFLAGAAGINTVRGNGLQDTSSASRQKYHDADSTIQQKIKRLVHMEVVSQTGTTKIPKEDYLTQAFSLAEKTGNLDFLAIQLGYEGNYERHAGHYPLALSIYSQGLKIAEKLNDTDLMAQYYNNIGVVFRKIDDYQNALEYIVKAVHLNTLIHDSLGLAMSLNNLGNAQMQLHKYSDAMSSFKKSMKAEQNRKNKIGLAINLNNIGNVYHDQKKYDKAISYYNLSLEINREINSLRGVAICYNDLSSVYLDEGNHQKSLDFARKALDIAKKISLASEEATAYLGIGKNYFRMHLYNKAIANINEGVLLMKPLGGKAFLEYSYRTLYKIYLDKKNYKKALHYLTLSNNYHDSLLNLAVQNNIEKLQIQYKTKQKENQIAILNQKARLAAANEKKQLYLIYFFLSTMLLMLFLLALVFISLHRRRKNNLLLTQKNKEIEEAKKALENNEIELIKSKEEAEKNALAKEQIMADLSHEIRTPLNSVIGFSDLLYKTLENPKQKKYLKDISASSRGLLNFINEILLDSSKQGEGTRSIELSDFNLKECIREISTIFALKVEEKHIDLKITYSEAVPQVIHFNKMILQQILLNLVGNAIKFTDHGYVEIMVSSKKENEKGFVQLNIEIKDSGVGISLDEQKQIFKPFHQAIGNGRHEGSGLGLSITESLVKKMNGTIHLISKKGNGSRFILNFNHVKVYVETTPTDITASLLHNIQFPPFLFLNQKNKNTATVKSIIEKSGFTLLDVGVNLTSARKHFQESFLIILCCLGHDELINTLAILENEILKKEQRFLIISKTLEPSIKEKNDITFLVPDNIEDLSEKIKDFLKSYQMEILENILFKSNSMDLQDSEIKKTFDRIFKNEYTEAFSTHMLGNISKLADELNDVGKRYEMANLVAFSETLIQNVDQFDTHGIDKQLDILAKAFRKSFDLI